MSKRERARTSQAELDAWVLATAPRALAYATSLLRDPVQAEDIVQDCYCRLLQKAAVYDLPRDGGKLLFKSISNACINLCTRKPPVVSSDGGNWDVADRRTLAPDEALMQRELEQAVQEGLGRLPAPQRAALQLKSLGHSQQEIAESLDITTTNAGVLVHRARQALADFLAERVGEAAE